MNENKHTNKRHDFYTQMPLYMIALFVVFDIWMFTISVAAGVVGIIITAVYAAMTIVLYISSRVSSDALFANQAMENGVEAVDTFMENKDIALIILDVMMPRMDGWEDLHG